MTADQIRPEEDVEDLRKAFDDPSQLPRSASGGTAKKNGELIPVKVTSFNLDFDGRSARLGVIEDLTERLQAEERAQESERRYRELLEAARAAQQIAPLLNSPLAQGISMLRQRSLKSSVSASGVGLHTGQKGAHHAAPGAAGYRHRVPPRRSRSPVDIPARAELVGETRARRRAWSRASVKVYTVEHLMSALGGLGVDNVYVDLDAPELPIMDGSASPFVLLIQQAGIERAGGAEAVPARDEARGGEGRRQVGAPRAVRRLQARLLDRLPPSGDRALDAGGEVNFAETSYLRKSRARALSASCTRWRSCATTASRSAAASTTRWCSTNTACSTPRACASPTSSSATSCSTRSATCTCSASRCSPRSRAHKSGHALNNKLLRARCSPQAGALETVELRAAGRGARPAVVAARLRSTA